MGVQLHQASGDDAAQRVAPGNRAQGLTAGRVEEIKQGNLILECLLQRPAGRTISRASQRIALVQERRSGQGITGILRRVRLTRKHIAVTVEHQRPIPIRGDGNNVAGPIWW